MINLGEAILVTAEVLAVNKADRVVTLLGPNDNEVDIKVTEEARNFYQLKVGDQVKFKYFESMAILTR